VKATQSAALRRRRQHADREALAGLCDSWRDHRDLACIIIGHGTAMSEETAWFLNLTVKVAVPILSGQVQELPLRRLARGLMV
jgi:hypothetical protein